MKLMTAKHEQMQARLATHKAIIGRGARDLDWTWMGWQRDTDTRSAKDIAMEVKGAYDEHGEMVYGSFSASYTIEVGCIDISTGCFRSISHWSVRQPREDSSIVYTPPTYEQVIDTADIGAYQVLAIQQPCYWREHDMIDDSLALHGCDQHGRQGSWEDVDCIVARLNEAFGVGQSGTLHQEKEDGTEIACIR